MIFRWITAVALALLVAGAEARPLFLNGGQPGTLGGGTGGGGGGAPAEDCGTGTVCAAFQSGQAFITWPDAATGAPGANFRYRVYRSTAPITSGNYTSATLIASYVLNNSGQLYGGDPTSGATQGVNAFTQSYRQDASRPMVVLANLGTPLAYGTGLQVYTATSNGNAYYAIVSTNISDGSPSYIGSVGPIAETVATPVAIKYADSLARGQAYGKLTSATNLPLVYRSHASSITGGCSTANCQWGDYWEMWLTPAEGWQDGRPIAFSVSEDVAQRNPSLARSYEVLDRDTIWTSDGLGGMETIHVGMGMTPNPLVGPANRYYLTGRKQIERFLNWSISHFSADPNQIHWRGHSMGAWGGASTGIRMTSPRLASMWLEYPVWRQDRRSCAGWAGLTWSGTMPFRATLGAGSQTLGCTVASVLTSDGSTWGGTGGYADAPGFIAANPGNDLPFTAWSIGKYDPYPASGNTTLGFSEQLDALAAFQSAHRGHAFCWATMAHETTATPQAPIDRDAPVTDSAVAYRKDKFKLNLPYIALTGSSIDDNPGTATPTTNGLLNGDYLGCKNAGFTWNVTTDTGSAFNFTVGNAWMARNPTTIPTTTLSGTMASSGSGSVAATSTAGWLATGQNMYALVGNDASPATQEVVAITGTAGNTIAFTSRGLFGTTAQSHASGVTIRQLVTQPTGPNGGPYATMTADVTPRRVQNFIKSDGSTVSCTITPNGGGATVQTPTVANGLWTLTGVPINASGVTSIACN